jgi:hypothetical protein
MENANKDLNKEFVELLLQSLSEQQDKIEIQFLCSASGQ